MEALLHPILKMTVLTQFLLEGKPGVQPKDQSATALGQAVSWNPCSKKAGFGTHAAAAGCGENRAHMYGNDMVVTTGVLSRGWAWRCVIWVVS